MRFGLGPLTIESVAGKQHVDVYEEALEQAEIAENWGFDSVWVDERNFTPGAFNSSASVVGAAVAQRSTYVRIGLMPLAGLVNAIYVAEEVACIDNISNGRVIVACQEPGARVAGGWGGDPSVDRIRDDLAVMRKAWGPNPFNHHSPHHTIPGEMAAHTIAAGLHSISVQPKPAQLELPLWVAGTSVAAEVAAAETLPFFGPSHLSLEELRPLYSRREPGHGEIVPLAREVFIARTGAEARESAGPALERLYARFGESGDAESGSFDGLARDRFVIGDPEQCIEQLYRYQHELGVNYVVARLAYHEMHAGETARAIQLFGQAVIPEFRMFGLPDEIRRLA